MSENTNFNILKNPWIYFIMIVFVLGIFYFYPENVESGKYDEFAQYLTEQGVIMYGTEWCSHC